MPRYLLRLEYDGGPFVGWQRQDNGPSVQQALEEAVLGFSGDETVVQGAGRTDAGVHALGQAAHLDLTQDWDAETVRDAINFHLKPDPITVLSAERVEDDFNARFDATQRCYLYRIFNRRPPPALERGFRWWVPVHLDVEAMHEAGQVLVGKHDFTTFRATHCQAKSPVRTLDGLQVVRADDEIHIHVHALSFLHHQVRNITGTLRWVGEGKWTKADVKTALDARDRSAGGPTAPADGLYLVDVEYGRRG